MKSLDNAHAIASAEPGLDKDGLGFPPRITKDASNRASEV